MGEEAIDGNDDREEVGDEEDFDKEKGTSKGEMGSG